VHQTGKVETQRRKERIDISRRVGLDRFL
jgi:hypothetical protein